MKAVVLVGGLGTRLRPLTYHTPKQMLPVVNRPMIEWAVLHLAAHGVDEVILSLGYGADAFLAHYPDGTCAGVPLRYAVEDEPLDTAGAVRFAARQAGVDERFLVVNSDVITDLDISAFVAFHEQHGGAATIALHQVDDPSRFGVVPTAADGRVIAFIEKPAPGTAPTDRINAGTYVLEPSVLDRIPDGRPVSIERETFPALVERGELFAMDDDGAYWLDTGTPAAYIQAHVDIIEGRYRGEGAGGAAAIDSCCTVAPSAKIDRAAVGPNAVIGEDVELVTSVVLAGARVEQGARVVSSIVGPGALVGAGAQVLDLTVLGEGVHIAPGATLRGARVPDTGEEG